MKNEPFFTRDGDIYQPQPVARGPWDPKSLHGRVVVGLLAHAIEQAHGGPDFMPARLTVDMYRLPDLGPVELTVRLVRGGARIRVVDAEFLQKGVSMGRATCQLLKRTASPEGRIWSPPPWDAPAPDDVAPPPDSRFALGGMWAMRPMTPGPIFGEGIKLGPRRTWMAEVRELVGGEPLTPFVRVAVAADFASPFANSGEKGLAYINTDVTLYLHRLPATEWIGFETSDHGATDGVAIGACRLHDETGPIGSATVAALAQRRMEI
jgi:hypothetical protein